MQFLTLFAAASALATVANAAAIQNFVQFYIESDNQDVNNKGLSSTHEGAGFNYFFLGDDAESLDFDPKTGDIYTTLKTSDGTAKQVFGVESLSAFPGLELTVAESGLTKWTIDDGYLKGNGSDNFYVAKSTGDPYRISENSYQVGLFPHGASTAAFKDVEKVKVKVTRSATL